MPKKSSQRDVKRSGQREREEIDQHAVKQAVADIGEKVYETYDSKETGLSLLVQKTRAMWILRGRIKESKQSIWRIGSAADLGIKEARDRAEKAKVYLTAGHDPGDFLLEKAADGLSVVHHDAAKDGWTFLFGREHFLAFTQKQRREDAFKDYRRTLTSKVHGDLKPLEGKLLKHITQNDIKVLHDTISLRSASMADHRPGSRTTSGVPPTAGRSHPAHYPDRHTAPGHRCPRARCHQQVRCRRASAV
jgi:hypothetical protein